MQGSPARPTPAGPEAGAVTIMVALSMLVFVTIVAAGMCRNSLREIMISGTTRQGVMAQNAADSGIEWAIFWFTTNNVPTSAQTSANALVNPTPTTGLAAYLLANDSLRGLTYNLNQSVYTTPTGQSVPSDLTIPGPSGMTQGFTIGLMRMGKTEPTDISFSPTAGNFQAAPNTTSQSNWPDLWAVRADGQAVYPGITFTQSREAWISTPARLIQ